MEREVEHGLIRRASKGDQGAASDLIRAHQPSVYAYLLRMSGRHDVAEDITQEAFVRVITNLHRFDYRFRFSTWLFTIARRLHMNAAARMRPAYDTDLVSGVGGRRCGPEEPVERAETGLVQKDALQHALLRLSTEQREVLVLFHQLDWPIAVIAQHLEMPEGTVKSHLHRGRNRLRQHLMEQGHSAETFGLDQYAVAGAGGDSADGAGVVP